ncbi:hypothetical protein SAMN02787079_03041 [Lysinibacillus sp. TC-37]|nr:hypothetical protein SAMN02787078_02485 [Lysinibacillus sp. SG9]SDB40708.1 hypothetical protein SAMN02787079_03041 [Lysinibacillus sp. TC-37]SFT01182.1 hypothetical protein SAMN02787087_03068 [Lysinibacillus sp. SG55]
MGYILELRKYIGSRPIISIGATILVSTMTRKFSFNIVKIRWIGDYLVAQWN